MSSIAAMSRTWLTEADCDLDTFRALVEQSTDPAAHPSAERVELNVPLYDSDRLRSLTATEEGRRTVQTELVRTLMDGPGIVVLKGAFTDPAVVDRASAAFRELIEEERAAGTARRRPLREARRQRPRLERPGQDGRTCARTSSPTTTPTTCWP